MNVYNRFSYKSLLFLVLLFIFNRVSFAESVSNAIVEDFSDMVLQQDKGFNDFSGNIGEFNKDGVPYGSSTILTTPSESTGMRFSWDFTKGTNDSYAYTGLFFCIFGLCDNKVTFTGDPSESNAVTVTYQEHSISLDNIDGILNEPSGPRKFISLNVDLAYNSTNPITLRLELKDVNGGIRYKRFSLTQSTTLAWDFRQNINGVNGNIDLGHVKVVSLVIERNNVADGVSNPDTGSFDLKRIYFVADRNEQNPANNLDQLDLLERRTFQYFIDWTSRKPTSFAIPQDRSTFADLLTVGGVGFALPAYVIGAERGWITRDEARKRTLAVLRLLSNTSSFGPERIGRIGYKGWFYHFLGIDGKRKLNFDFTATPINEALSTAEVSSIDTGLAIMGTLIAQSYFTGSDAEETEIRSAAQTIYDQVDWPFMLEPARQQFFLGWKPNEVRDNTVASFLYPDLEGNGQFTGTTSTAQTLDNYTDEATIVSLLALGSTTKTVPRSVYCAWKRDKDTDGLIRTWPGSLFTYQFLQAFMETKSLVIPDFPGCPGEATINWHDNTQLAIRKVIQSVISNAGGFNTYSPSAWGITAAEGPDNLYHAYTIPNVAREPQPYEDGSIMYYGMVSSLGFAMQNSKIDPSANDIYNSVVLGINGGWQKGHWHYRFGLPDAFNSDISKSASLQPNANWLRSAGSWVNRALFSIDQGPMLLHLENARTGLIWKLFENNPNIQRAFNKLKSTNKAPTADSLSFNTIKSLPIFGQLTGNDPEHNPLTYSLRTNSSHGRVKIDAVGKFSYNPIVGYTGQDSFTYLVNDGIDIGFATVVITITDSYPPVPYPDNLTTSKCTSVSGQLVATDPENDPITFSALTQPSHGTATVSSNGSLNYIPTCGYTGTDSFTYQASDDNNVATALVTVTINELLDPTLKSAAISGIDTFVIGKSKLGRLSLAYCDVDCKTIYYRHLNADGTWSAPEIVKDNWNRNTEYGIANFTIEIDSTGNPHIFYGDSSLHSVFHATRSENGVWNTVIDKNIQSSAIGRLNSAHFDQTGLMGLITTYDYRVYGGYPFSYLSYLSGYIGSTPIYEGISVADENIYDIDMAIGSNNLPIIAVAQRQFGGSFASKLVYKTESGWTERVLQTSWNLCVQPIQIAVGSVIHVNSCGKYTRLATLNTPPDFHNYGSYAQNMAIDESDRPYFTGITNSKIFLTGLDNTNSNVSLLVDSGNSHTAYNRPILYDNGVLILAYIDASQAFKVNIYSRDDLVTYFKSPSILVLNKQGSGIGTISGTNIDCGVTCSQSYPQNSTVELTATADSNSVFIGWSGDCAGTGKCTLTMDTSKNVTANFSAIKSIQNIIFGPSPNVIVGSSGSLCAKGGASGLPVVLIADGTFCTITDITVNGAIICGNLNGLNVGQCKITGNQDGNDKYFPAPTLNQEFPITTGSQAISFGPAPKVVVGGTGTVSATGGTSGNPVTFSSTTTSVCTTSGINGSTVTGVTVGACTIAANQAGNANYNAALQMTQSFGITTGFTLTVINANVKFGTVTSNVGGISCGTTCSANYASGSNVTLTAIPVSGYQFTGWGGACSGYGNSCTVTMSTAQTVTAKFAPFKIHQPVWKRMIKSIIQKGG